VSTNSPNATDTAAANNTGLTLIPPQPVPVVTETDADAMVKVDAATSSKIDGMVGDYVKSLASLDPHSQDFSSKVNAIHSMGNDEIRQSASVSNRLLDKPVKAMESGPFSKSATVSKSLVDLRHTVEDLDPSRQGLMNPKHLFGLIPFGSRLRDYFARYQSAQGHLNAIIQALYRGQDELRKDNAAIEQEKVNIWDIKGKLEQYIYLAGKLDAAMAAPGAMSVMLWKRTSRRPIASRRSPVDVPGWAVAAIATSGTCGVIVTVIMPYRPIRGRARIGCRRVSPRPIRRARRVAGPWCS